jgi:hypothetical protein
VEFIGVILVPLLIIDRRGGISLMSEYYRTVR